MLHVHCTMHSKAQLNVTLLHVTCTSYDAQQGPIECYTVTYTFTLCYMYIEQCTAGPNWMLSVAKQGGEVVCARASKNRCCFDSTSFAHSCPQDWWPTLWSQVVTKMWPSCDLIEPNCDPSNLSNIQKLVWTTHQFTWLKRACCISPAQLSSCFACALVFGLF